MMQNDEQTLLGGVLSDLLREKRIDRWLKSIRFLLWFTLIALITWQIFRAGPSKMHLGEKHVALIRLDGMIATGRDFSAEEVLPLLQQAFSATNSVGVLLTINSPGGTPVQSAIIHDEIIRLKAKYGKKVIAVGEDLLTSGAYFVAVSADKIYVNPNTLTGSIGVIMKGFGFVDAMKKLGIERRVYIAGDNKDRLDPFLPQNADDVKKIRVVMQEVHQNFVNAVIASRKNRLKADTHTLFTGDFWSGQTALQLGLVDGLGNWTTVLASEWGSNTPYEEYGSHNSLFKLLSGGLTNLFDHLVYT